MSTIQGEITRIAQNVADSLTAVANKGVTVPSGSNSDDLAGLIAQISGGGGGGGLEYEEGTYTPASNIARPTISFAKTHTYTPIFTMLVDFTNDTSRTTYSNYLFVYIDFAQYGAVFKVSESESNYGHVTYCYRTNGTETTSQGAIRINNTSGSSAVTDRGYWLTNTSFYPYTYATNRYWRTGRTYKWIAVWGPTT